eukprot:354470-Chlamydomonas_euryale.AAC.42
MAVHAVAADAVLLRKRWRPRAIHSQALLTLCITALTCTSIIMAGAEARSCESIGLCSAGNVKEPFVGEIDSGTTGLGAEGGDIGDTGCVK